MSPELRVPGVAALPFESGIAIKVKRIDHIFKK
jgi:hypothetical protein